MQKPTGPWNLYELDQPQKITAGFVGLAGEQREEVFFDCCECGEVDAVMHGYMAQCPERADVAILRKPHGSYRPAFYCAACWQNLLAEDQSNDPA